MKNRLKRQENITGYLFVAPALFVFLVLIAFPFIASLLLSLTKWNFLSGLKGIKWVGLKNFKTIFSSNDFLYAMRNTLVYTVATVPTSILFALLLAWLLNDKVYLKKPLRLAFFIPYISSTVALAAVFRFLFRSEGIINVVLKNVFHVAEPPQWLVSPDLNRLPIILLLFWTAIGYELIIYMAALQNVPKELYEASELDGATGFKQFLHVTFPLISPTTFYLVVVRMIAAFKVFSSVNIITQGTAFNSNTSMVVEIYREAFVNYRFGDASAEAVVLFVVILLITLFQFWGQKKWVHY